ncbi:MAG: RDD family protein [Cryomorphaceae bacterium]
MVLAGKSYRAINLIVDSSIIAIIASVYDYLTGYMYSVWSYFFFSFLYYFILELKYQKTIGKVLTNTKVVGLDGAPPKSGNIALRSICRFFHFDVLSYWVGAYGMHDGYSRTMTVVDQE